MSYKVLYRKYRPNDFENVVGQDYIIKTLKNSVTTGNISHAYIFSGPRGTGKTSTAKIFAKAINCLNLKNGSPCNNCEFCNSFLENPDIIEIDAASHNGVDQVRELIDNVKLSPSNGKYKVYIIDEVHMLTISAFNALLLTLEEPPKHAVFIFATTNIENVPITILSRCQRYDFRKISVSDIVQRLKKICNIENISIEDDALNEIAFISEGGLRDALSMLDQLSKENDVITLEKVETQMRSVSNSSLKKLIDFIENNEIEKIIEYIEFLKNKATDYKTFIKKFITNCSLKAIDIKITSKVHRLNYDEYQKLILELIESLNNININVDPFVILELILLKYVDNIKKEEIKHETELSVEIKKEVNDLLKKENIEDKSNMKKFINIRINNCFVNAKKDNLIKLQSNFSDFIKDENVSKQIITMIFDSSPVASSETYAIFIVNSEHTADNINENVIDIENNYNKKYNSNLKFVFISKNRWLIEKEKYINNIKQGVTYNYLEDIDIDESEINADIVTDLFDIEKIEII